MPTNIDPGSVVTTKISTFFNDQPLGIGTGFFYNWNGQHYLVTAWHVITGRNSETLVVEHSSACPPNRIVINLCFKGTVATWFPCSINLYEDMDDANPQKSLWLEHTRYGHRVDVAAIPIAIPENAEIRTVDFVNDLPNMLLQVTQQVFVLGYPRGIDGGGNFPIWKRGSIATEPYLPLYGGLPRMLIDTATREGMSGAPVVAISEGRYQTENGDDLIVDSTRRYRFLGAYSGRLGKGFMEAQLGIVWKARVISEIIQVPKIGESSFNLIPLPTP